MRRQLITLLFSFLTAVLHGQNVNNDLSFFSYNYDKPIIKRNKVETVTIETFYSDGVSSTKAIYYFDNQGLLKKQTILDSTGIALNEFYFISNSHEDLVTRIKKDYHSNKVDTVFYFKYYEKDKLIKDSSSDIPLSYKYEYNKTGKLSRTIIDSNFDLVNKKRRIILNRFDGSGKVINISETVYQNENDLTGSLFSNRDISYNQTGKIVKESEKLNHANSFLVNYGTIIYGYDSYGKLIKVLRENAASYFYTYYQKGLIKSQKMIIKLDDTKIETLSKYTYTFRQ